MKPGLVFIWGAWRAQEGGCGLLKDKSNNYLTLLAFQLLLSLVAPKYYCVCDWSLECSPGLGFSGSGWLSPPAETSPGTAELRVTSGGEPSCIVQPWAGDYLFFDFTLFQLFSLFSLLFSCLLQSSLFKSGWGKGDTQGRSTQHGEQFSPLSAVQIAFKPRPFNPLWAWAHAMSAQLGVAAVLKWIKSFQCSL